MSEMTIRRATLADVEEMHHLINYFAERGLMLPKARSKLYQNIRDFVVAEHEGRFAGCCAMHVLWNDLGEIRSLAVDEAFQKNGVGRKLALAAVEDALALRLPRVFVLTYQQAFFEHLGFTVVEKTLMPQKTWGECMDCPKFPNCDEIAMIMDVPVEPGSIPIVAAGVSAAQEEPAGCWRSQEESIPVTTGISAAPLESENH